MNFPKVLVGVITASPYEYCLREFLDSVKSFIYDNFDLVVVDNSEDNSYYDKLKSLSLNVIKDEHIKDIRDRLVHSRNILRDYALKNNYDYLLSLEQDIIAPKDTINRLVRHNKDIVTAVYFKLVEKSYFEKNKLIKKTKELYPVLFQFAPKEMKDKMRFVLPLEVRGDKFFKVRASGLGCILISRKVLEKIKFRTVKGNTSYDDLWFCDDAIKHRFDIYVDTSVKCKHLFIKKDKNLFKKN